LQTPTDPWQSLIRLLRYRPRSIAEARTRLQSQGFSDEAIAQTLQRAESADLLNDSLFARLWVEDRLLNHPLSRQAIKRELLDKGIAKCTVTQIVEQLYSPEKERLLAVNLAQERFKRYHGLDEKRRIRRMMSYLTRRGFSFPLAREIVRSLEVQYNDD